MLKEPTKKTIKIDVDVYSIVNLLFIYFAFCWVMVLLVFHKTVSGYLRGVMVNSLEWEIVVSELELQSWYEPHSSS